MSTQPHWSEQTESTSLLGIRLLMAVFRLGGRVSFFLTLWPVVLVFWLVSGPARRASSDWLKQVAHHAERPAPRPFASLRHLWRFADTILDKLLAVSGFFTDSSLAVEGADELLADTRGAVLVTAHTGCLELCQMLGEANQRTRRPVTVLVHTRHAVRFNALIARINPRFAVNHIEVTALTPQTAIEMAQRIEQGHWIVIVADRTPIGSQAVLPVTFMGRTAPVAQGPFLMAALLECRVWSMICTRETRPASRARYRLRFTAIGTGEKLGRKNRSAALQAMAQRWSDALETAMVESPLDWFNFFDFWRPADSTRAAASRDRNH
ncbi:MAG: acyltransferase [Duodenibacillus sp.]|nr:acyltransferase [Duodenibacillus sp.]